MDSGYNNKRSTLHSISFQEVEFLPQTMDFIEFMVKSIYFNSMIDSGLWKCQPIITIANFSIVYSLQSDVIINH